VGHPNLLASVFSYFTTHPRFKMTSRANGLLLGIVLLVSFTTGTASRIFAISLPSIAVGLHTDMVGISWALISFQLATASLSLVFGRVGDVYGRQKVYIWGIVLFTASSLMCGLSSDIWQLIIYRVLQGVGAAMIQAQGRALAMDASTEESRGRAQGFMTTAHHGGFLFGPVIGGFIIQYAHWRGIFFFLVPLGVTATALGLCYRRLHESAVSDRPTNGRAAIDYIGAALLVATTLVLMGILDRQAMEALTATWRTVAVTALVALVAAFLARENYASSPIISLTLFRIRMFAFSTITLLLVSIVLSLTLYLLPFYLQDVLGLTPSFMGMLFLSAPVFAATLSPLGGAISDRVGPTLPATVGVIIFSGASFLGIQFEPSSHWILPTLVLALGGLGSALFFPANHTALISSVPLEHRGVATGALYTMFGLGNVFGVTIGNFLMTVAFRIHSGNPDVLPTTANQVHFVSALQDTFLITTGIAVAAATCSVFRARRRPRP